MKPLVFFIAFAITLFLLVCIPIKVSVTVNPDVLTPSADKRIRT